MSDYVDFWIITSSLHFDFHSVSVTGPNKIQNFLETPMRNAWESLSQGKDCSCEVSVARLIWLEMEQRMHQLEKHFQHVLVLAQQQQRRQECPVKLRCQAGLHGVWRLNRELVRERRLVRRTTRNKLNVGTRLRCLHSCSLGVRYLCFTG